MSIPSILLLLLALSFSPGGPGANSSAEAKPHSSTEYHLAFVCLHNKPQVHPADVVEPPPSAAGPDLALLTAVRHNDLAAVSAALQAGARGNAVDSQGNTSLMLAANKASIEIVRLLLHHGADVNAKDKDDQTVAWYSVTHQRVDMMRLLIRQGARTSSLEMLAEAAGGGNNDMVRLLLAHGAKVDIYPGSTALMEASDHGHRSTIDLLLAHGADINYCARFGSALTTAAEKGDLPMVKFLVVRGADANMKDAYRTVLAAAVKHPDVVSYLIKHGAKVDKPGKWDITPLCRAAFLGETAGVRVLLAHGAHINHIDGNGNTPLMSAASAGHIEVVRALIRGGANINLRTFHREQGTKLSALQIAHQAGQTKIVRLLRQAGAR
jgi:uncharacterized protein